MGEKTEATTVATKGLVLGGGGVIGIAWEAGVLKGLRDGGIDPAAADLVIGTSAGSVVGAHLRVGASLDALYAAQLAPSEGAVEGSMTELDTAALMQVFARWGGLAEMTSAAAAEIGALALSARTVPEERWLQTFAQLFGPVEWPEGRLLLTAVDTADGSFTVWTRESGVPLLSAVASSCAVPGMFPPVTLGERRYMDGGVRSGTSADLARGLDTVLIVAPIGASDQGIGGIARRQIDAEAAELALGGSDVTLLLPDAAALDAFGPNLMDPARRAPAAEAGLRQGAEVARQLGARWT